MGNSRMLPSRKTGTPGPEGAPVQSFFGDRADQQLERECVPARNCELRRLVYARVRFASSLHTDAYRLPEEPFATESGRFYCAPCPAGMARAVRNMM